MLILLLIILIGVIIGWATLLFLLRTWLVVGVKRGSPLILDNWGLTVELEE